MDDCDQPRGRVFPQGSLVDRGVRVALSYSERSHLTNANFNKTSTNGITLRFFVETNYVNLTMSCVMCSKYNDTIVVETVGPCSLIQHLKQFIVTTVTDSVTKNH